LQNYRKKLYKKIKVKIIQENQNIIIKQQGDQKIKLPIKILNIHDL
jgi:hypothetical protein